MNGGCQRRVPLCVTRLQNNHSHFLAGVFIDELYISRKQEQRVHFWSVIIKQSPC
jgi:hypothetical protein